MFLLPERNLERDQVGPIIRLIQRNLARSVRELPGQFCLVNLFQYPSEKDNPLLADVPAAVVLDVRDVQVIDDSLDRSLIALVLLLESAHRLGRETFAKDVILEQDEPRPEHGRVADGHPEISGAPNPGLQIYPFAIIPFGEFGKHIVGSLTHAGVGQRPRATDARFCTAALSLGSLDAVCWAICRAHCGRA
jgi:hypothetical protein